MDGMEADAEPVPDVDHARRHRKLGEFLCREMLERLLVEFVRNAGIGDFRHRLDPCEGCALPIGEQRRFLPCGDEIEPLLGLAVRARLTAVHLDAERTAVDLRRPQLDQMQQALFEPAFVDRLVQRDDRLDQFRRLTVEIQPGLHLHSFHFLLVETDFCGR
jgi:hypothetical protein